MSHFSVFHLTSSNQTKAIACAVACTENCKFQINSTIGDIVNLAVFLRLAVKKQICTDEKTLNGFTNLADQILTYVVGEFPFFSDIKEVDPEFYFDALKEAAEPDLGEVTQILDSLFQKFRQFVDEVDSSDAADESSPRF